MFFGGGKTIKNIFFAELIVAAMLFSWNIAQTETQTGNIGVQMTVPTNTTSTEEEPTTSCTVNCEPAPLIEILASSTTMTGAQVIWKVNSFGYTLGNTSIIYGIGTDLTGTATAIASGTTEFFVNIFGLNSDTIYNFKIFARNSDSPTVEVLGQFKTQKGFILNSLTILAKPEKRVEKTGGNLSATANILFFDPDANAIVTRTSTVLNPSGTTVLHNIEIQTGSTLSAILKTDAHLAKRINNVTTTMADLVLDFTDSNNFYLKAGDLAGNLQSTNSQDPFFSFLKGFNRDEFVDILDISAVVSKFNNQTPGEAANLNGDTIVDAQDISIVLGNWNREGDIIVK